MLTCGEFVDPDQARLYTRLLGLARLGAEPEPASDAVRQFKALLRAVNLAGRLDVRMAVEA
jgi:hypothetical protein